MYVVCAVKYICSNTGEKAVNKEVGSKCEVSIRDIALEGGLQAYIS
jgi:hypothetical protein